MLPGLMQPTPLTLHSIFDRMRTAHGDKTVVSVHGEGDDREIVRHTYAEIADRALRLCTVLRDMGVGEGDRVATFAYNSHRHLELYWAAPLLGAVLHTVNIRLYADQVRYIVDHAQDRVMFFDGSLVGVLADVAPDLDCVERWVDLDGSAAVGSTSRPADGPLADADDYETLLAAVEPMAFESLPTIDENAACGLCYTSGTTGMPKGVLSSHRGMWLHSMATCTTDSIGLGERDRVFPVVPMFHAFGWGLPYSAPFTGAELVFHGRETSPEVLGALIADEGVTVAAGVPTIWKDILPAIEDGTVKPAELRMVFVGGSASPASLIEAYQQRGIDYLQVWGMTETGPLAAASRPRRRHDGLDAAARLAIQERTGSIMFGLEARIVADDGTEVPWDGEAVGELEVKGPWIASGYYENEGFTRERFHDGWLRTGDMAWMEPDGYFRIVDRAKDLVKSGGEWISSVELEGALLSHPKVRDAAVVGCVSHKWDERPVAAVVLQPGEDKISLAEVRAHLAPHFAKWWLPDHVEIVADIPKTSVGKLDKKLLRTQLDHVRLP